MMTTLASSEFSHSYESVEKNLQLPESALVRKQGRKILYLQPGYYFPHHGVIERVQLSWPVELYCPNAVVRAEKDIVGIVSRLWFGMSIACSNLTKLSVFISSS